MTVAKIHSTKILHEGKVFRLVKENVTLPNGANANLDIIKHPGASAMVPITKDKNVLILKQYRHAVSDYIWEIPAGTLNPNEIPLDCAQRELIEETGYKADKWRKLGEIVPVPGYSTERIHLFLASELTPAEQNLDKDEVLKVYEISLEKVMDMISSGEIIDSKTINGLFLAYSWISKH
ncbi:MAG: NUDIX hydrolase [Desulfobacterales bacterium]|nr:NUDIX hydrolase [Desulfobacterales bacterium]